MTDYLAIDRENAFQAFERRLDAELLHHPVITGNAYCAWFATAGLEAEDIADFTRQFSVFSNQFLIAQTRKMINAGDLAEMRAAKEILANEIGVVFRPKGASSRATAAADPDLVGTEGSVEGGTFRFRAGHYEWLLAFAEPLGLAFADMGRRSIGTPATLTFCDRLIAVYGSEDVSTSAGAGFAIENWAAAGFWKQLIAGLERFNARTGLDLPLGFFRWHDMIEDQHAEHTRQELRELWFGDIGVDEDRFIAGGNQVLDGLSLFWDGLDRERRLRRIEA